MVKDISLGWFMLWESREAPGTWAPSASPQGRGTAPKTASRIHPLLSEAELWPPCEENSFATAV